MEKRPRISIIAPVYNTGIYLQDCINSILNQSFKDFELLLVDDGSTDGSISIEQQACQSDNRVRCYSSNASCVSVARNMGIEQAKGDYIFFIDSDDYLKPDALKILIEAADRFEKADFIQGAFSVLTNGKMTERSSRFDILEEYSNITLEGLEYIDKLGFTITYPWNSLIKRDFLIENNVRFKKDLRVQEDLVFIIDIFLKGAIGVLINIPTYVYRWGRPGSLTSVDKKLSAAEVSKRKRLLEALILSAGYLTEIKKSIPSEFKDSHFAEILNNRISDNLTGCIGGCTLIHPDKEIFNLLKAKFPKIPVGGETKIKRMLARIYNLNPQLAYNLRKALNIRKR